MIRADKLKATSKLSELDYVGVLSKLALEALESGALCWDHIISANEDSWEQGLLLAHKNDQTNYIIFSCKFVIDNYTWNVLFKGLRDCFVSHGYSITYKASQYCLDGLITDIVVSWK
jgi:hypothetical protein